MEKLLSKHGVFKQFFFKKLRKPANRISLKAECFSEVAEGIRNSLMLSQYLSL